MLTLLIAFSIVSLVGGYLIGDWLDKKEKEFIQRKEPLLKR